MSTANEEEDGDEDEDEKNPNKIMNCTKFHLRNSKSSSLSSTCGAAVTKVTHNTNAKIFNILFLSVQRS